MLVLGGAEKRDGWTRSVFEGLRTLQAKGTAGQGSRPVWPAGQTQTRSKAVEDTRRRHGLPGEGEGEGEGDGYAGGEGEVGGCEFGFFLQNNR